MGALPDAFPKRDRVEVTFSGLYRLTRESTPAELMKNAVDCNVSHRCIRETVTGVLEEIDMELGGKGGKRYMDADTE